MRLRRTASVLLITFCSVLGLVTPTAHASSFLEQTTRQANAELTGSRANCPGPYHLGRWQLGPKDLPAPTTTVGAMLKGYERPANELVAALFLASYWEEDIKSWRYPKNQGFLGKPTSVTLSIGVEIDRFGSERGRFFAPVGTLYSQRSLPPSNLNTCSYGNGKPQQNSYYRYRVTKAFAVDAGTTKSWFWQPGGGRQYMVSSFPSAHTGDDVKPSAEWLVRNGYLERLDVRRLPTEHLAGRTPARSGELVPTG